MKVIAPDGLPYTLIELKNAQGLRATFTDWGASWLSCQVPVNGGLREVLLGCDLADFAKQNVYFGATVGRYANRIAKAQYVDNGKVVKLLANQGEHQLHGGAGFDKRRFRILEQTADCVRFGLVSPDGEAGFPGNVQLQVTYQLTAANGVKITYWAQSDKDTAFNITNHAYFNLQNADNADVRGHQLQLAADYYLPVDSQGIPNAPLKSVAETSFDFRVPKTLAQDFGQGDQQATKGYDHAFLLNLNAQPQAQLTSPNGDLTLQLFTSQGALQVYTGNYLGGTPARGGATYADFSGVALETQCLPDSPNHPEWLQPFKGILRAGETYAQWTEYRFLPLG